MKNSELHFLSRLSAYTVSSFLLRLVMVSGVGLLFLFFAVKIGGPREIELTITEYLLVVLIFNIISETNVLLDHIAERLLPIPEKLSLRVVLHFVVSFTIALSAVFYFFLIVKDDLFFSHSIVQLMMLFGLFFIFILILVSITLRIIEKWIYSVRQLEEFKSLKLISDYKSLQSQLNPHFLFNNLSVLKSMITFDPAAAIHFIQNFTDVYRYVLQSKDKTTVKLSDEVDFIKSYASLHKERLGEAFSVKIRVSEPAGEMEIPPLALQLLVENAVKHNIAVKEEPLLIEITAEEGTLTVRNNINLKESVQSEQTGLENLEKRYSLLTSRPMKISQDDNKFEVKIPLL
jgi:two-component system, LytTR family, sensor kinase